MFSNENFILFIVFLHKSHIRVNFSPWDMGQNFLNHISRTNQWSSLIFWYKFTWIKWWSKNCWVGLVKDECVQSSHGTLKLTIPQEGTKGINWYSACWCKFRKTKNYFSYFWAGIVKNGCDPKICILRMSSWIELIFCLLFEMQ